MPPGLPPPATVITTPVHMPGDQDGDGEGDNDGKTDADTDGDAATEGDGVTDSPLVGETVRVGETVGGITQAFSTTAPEAPIPAVPPT